MSWWRRFRSKWPDYLMYGFFVVAGVLAFIFPSRAILEALQSLMVYLWSGFLLAGSALSLIGSMRGSFWEEVIGVPLICSSNAILGLALFLYGSSSAAIAIGCIFWGIALGLLPRWFERREALKISKRSQEREGSDGP